MCYLAWLRAWGVLCLSRGQLRAAHTRFGLHELVQIHHVVPRSCADHPTLRSVSYDVEECYNFVMMPTLHGRRRLNLRPDRLVHDGGHPKYCAFVRARLDDVHTRRDMLHLVAQLHRAMRRATIDGEEIPWC